MAGAKKGLPDLKQCECHGVEMLWNPDVRYRAGGFWRCRIRTQDRRRARYANRPGPWYNHMLLKHRHHKAMARQRKREAV
jgi:hypothetical protein